MITYPQVRPNHKQDNHIQLGITTEKSQNAHTRPESRSPVSKS